MADLHWFTLSALWPIMRRVDHERICIRPVRARRAREGKPPAAWVMVDYWQRRRVAGFKPEAGK